MKTKYDLTPIREWKKKYPTKSIVFDENFNILMTGDEFNRCWGSGNYKGIIFKCSKCGKLYTTYGALKYYHKQCKGIPK